MKIKTLLVKVAFYFYLRRGFNWGLLTFTCIKRCYDFPLKALKNVPRTFIRGTFRPSRHL